jgi:hypothetical protein
MIVAWHEVPGTLVRETRPVRDGMIGEPDVFSFRMSLSKR